MYPWIPERLYIYSVYSRDFRPSNYQHTALNIVISQTVKTIASTCRTKKSSLTDVRSRTRKRLVMYHLRTLGPEGFLGIYPGTSLISVPDIQKGIPLR
ncbi:unnamed protein product [Penicillium roqueforti FM164]|uniref:Genomic scaffold, ProqFM164S01 n=1 Tax=Penicillium roqueforti (strain FM164) TaxID=1365484 RepID=W6PZX2_PENRF|nr:unnamed protein product [Penicillium roqueforti FM164]